MNQCIPGTTMKLPVEYRTHPFAPIENAMQATGGFTLAQVSQLTGLQRTTIQNWIKRGWVANTKDKRYGQTQIVRILLIQMLRECMQLEQIVSLLGYINGDVEDLSDDIIPDRELFEMLCRLIFALDAQKLLLPENIMQCMEEQLQNYREPIMGAKQKLADAMSVMVLAYYSARLKQLAQTKYQTLLCQKEMS